MSHQNYSIESNLKPQSKPNTGCIIGGCGTVGCGLFFGVPILGVTILAYLVFMTPVPINWIAKKIQEDNPDIKISPISGSVMKGFTVPSVEFPDENDPTRVNVLKDLKIAYPDLLKSLQSKEFNIEEISVGSARLYVDSKVSKGEDGSVQVGVGSDTGEEGTTSETAVTTETTEIENDIGGLERFRVRKVDINNVELIDPDKGFHFKLAELKLDGIDITPDRVKMGEFRIRSSVLDLTLSPIDVESGEGFNTSSKLELEAILKPNDQLHVIKPVDIGGNIEFISKDKANGQVEAFDGKLSLAFSGKDDQAQIQVTDLTLEDYFDVDPLLPGNINWSAKLMEKEGSDTSDTQSGSFTLGDAVFKVQPGIPTDPNHALVAIHEGDGDTITLGFINESDEDGKKSPAAFKIRSTKNPDMSQRNILAQLYFKAPFDDLTTEQQDRILVTLGHPKQGEE